MDDVFGKARDKQVGTNTVSHGAFVPIFDARCQNGKTFPLDQSAWNECQQALHNGSGQDIQSSENKFPHIFNFR